MLSRKGVKGIALGLLGCLSFASGVAAITAGLGLVASPAVGILLASVGIGGIGIAMVGLGGAMARYAMARYSEIKRKKQHPMTILMVGVIGAISGLGMLDSDWHAGKNIQPSSVFLKQGHLMQSFAPASGMGRFPPAFAKPQPLTITFSSQHEISLRHKEMHRLQKFGRQKS